MINNHLCTEVLQKYQQIYYTVVSSTLHRKVNIKKFAVNLLTKNNSVAVACVYVWVCLCNKSQISHKPEDGF